MKTMLVRQHDKIRDHLKALDEFIVNRDAKNASMELMKLSGTLQVHLGMEDKSLYPFLLKKDDQTIVDTANAFIDEMGGLGEVFMNFKNSWDGSKISEDIPGFNKDFRVINDALNKRMEKEENQLYPLI